LEGIAIFDWLRDWLEIYTWWELWLIVSIPTLLVGFWFFFSYLLGIPNDIIRGVAIWALLAILMLGAATVDALRKQRGK
jgi:hypothetical protein